MKVDLDKNDLISLVKGTDTNLNAMEHPKISRKYGKTYGRWDWNYRAFEKCTDEELYEIYEICKNSWNK